MYHEVLNIVCFEAFSVKRKENDLHRKYSHFGCPAENQSCRKISKIEQNLSFYFIYKALEQGVTGSVFKNFEK